MLVVDPAALILFLKPRFRRFLRFAVQPHNPVSPVGNVSEYEYMQGILPVFQNVVGIPAHDHAGALVGKLQDHIALDVPQKVRCGKAVHHAGDTLGGEGVGKQTAARGMLSVFLHKFGSETGLQSDLVHQFLVVKRNAEFFGDHASNGPSTGAKFPADCNNFLFHIDASL